MKIRLLVGQSLFGNSIKQNTIVKKTDKNVGFFGFKTFTICTLVKQFTHLMVSSIQLLSMILSVFLTFNGDNSK